MSLLRITRTTLPRLHTLLKETSEEIVVVCGEKEYNDIKFVREWMKGLNSYQGNNKASYWCWFQLV